MSDVKKRFFELAPEIKIKEINIFKAVRLAKTYSKKQRAVLIDRAVPLKYCYSLASDGFDQRERCQTIVRIKAGTAKSPWFQLMTPAQKRIYERDKKIHKIIRSFGEHEPEPMFNIYDEYGCIDQDAAMRAFLNLISLIKDVSEAEKLFLQAKDRVEKSMVA